MLKLGLEINLSHQTEMFLSRVIHELIEAFKQKPCPHTGPLTTEYTIMARFDIPADQPDFEINLVAAGADSEGNPVPVPEGATFVVENSNEAAIIGTLNSSSLEGNNLNGKVGVHVASPSADLGVIAYKLMSADGQLLGAGSDEFLVGAGAFAVATIKSEVPLTPVVA